MAKKTENLQKLLLESRKLVEKAQELRQKNSKLIEKMQTPLYGEIEESIQTLYRKNEKKIQEIHQEMHGLLLKMQKLGDISVEPAVLNELLNAGSQFKKQDKKNNPNFFFLASPERFSPERRSKDDIEAEIGCLSRDIMTHLISLRGVLKETDRLSCEYLNTFVKRILNIFAHDPVGHYNVSLLNLTLDDYENAFYFDLISLYIEIKTIIENIRMLNEESDTPLTERLATIEHNLRCIYNKVIGHSQESGLIAVSGPKSSHG